MTDCSGTRVITLVALMVVPLAHYKPRSSAHIQQVFSKLGKHINGIFGILINARTGCMGAKVSQLFIWVIFRGQGLIQFFSLFIQTSSPYYPDHIAPVQTVPNLSTKGSCGIGFSRIDSPDSGINGTFEHEF